jgi:hypothetical protein
VPSTVRLNNSGSAVTTHKGTGGVDAQREEELEAKRVREVQYVLFMVLGAGEPNVSAVYWDEN